MAKVLPFTHLSYFVSLCDESYVQLKVEKVKDMIIDDRKS